MKRMDVETEIRTTLARLRMPQPDYVLPSQPVEERDTHVEGQGPIFDWVVTHDETEVERRQVDGHEIVFLVMEAITAAVVRAQEEATRSYRKPGLLARLRGKTAMGGGFDDYSRQTWMDAHIRLMGSVHAGWGTRLSLHYEYQLRKYPLTPAERSQTRRLDLSVYGVD